MKLGKIRQWFSRKTRIIITRNKSWSGHDGLYDEMLDISKQILSMKVINQEQLDNFVFNYCK